MFKSQDILLICIIIILIIVICHCKKKNSEGFVSNIIFDTDKLEEVNAKLEKEALKINDVKNQIESLMNNYSEKEYLKKADGTYIEYSTGTPTEQKTLQKIRLDKLIDINNLVKLNNKLVNELKNNPYNEITYRHIIEDAIKERLNKITLNYIILKEKEKLEEIEDRKKPIKNIKHIDTSVMFDLEKIKPNDPKDDLYKIKYTTSKDNKKCETKCLTITNDNYEKTDADYYSFDDCIDNEEQNLKVNHIRSDYKCYKNDDDTIDVEKENLECENSLDHYLKYDENEYIKKYNDLLTYEDESKQTILSPLQIKPNNLQFLPNDFVVITPKVQPTNKPKQCLTVDDDGLSFQDCDLFGHQRFNYERTQTIVAGASGPTGTSGPTDTSGSSGASGASSTVV